jgi:hypothetical protein
MLRGMVEAEKARAVRPRRRRFQFSLATLLLVVTVSAVWLGFYADRAHRQRRAVEAFRALGGEVHYFHGGLLGPKDPALPGPAWLRNLMGVDFFDKVVAATFDQGPVRDEDLRCVEDLPELVRLVIASPEVTDAGLVHLQRLVHLTHLQLYCPQVTDAGLVQLQPLRELVELRMACQITDAGMPHLVPLANLRAFVSCGVLTSLPANDELRPRRRQDRIVAALDSPTVIDVTNCPLYDVTSYLSDYHNMYVRIDKPALEAARIRSDTSVTFNSNAVWPSRQGPLAEGLDLLLDPLGLGWKIGPDGLVVTSKDALAASRVELSKLRQALPGLKKVYVDW